MKRYENWEMFLFNAVDKEKKKPFSYGTHDCVLLASRLIESMTGEDIAAPMRGTYTTALGALKIMKREYGVDNVCDLASLFLPEIEIKKAKRGDVIFYKDEKNPVGALGVILGENAIIPSDDRCIYVPVSKCLRAWVV